MRTEKICIAAWLLFTIFLLFGSTGTVAQTYKRTFILEFAPKSFPIKKGHDGLDYIQPDTSLYNCTFENDTSKPELPYINYKMLLPDNYKIKKVSCFAKEKFYYDEGVVLRPNSKEIPVSTTSGDGNKGVTYPYAIHLVKATCTSEEVADGYRIGNFSIMPFYYAVEFKMLSLSTKLELTVIIEPVEEAEKVEHKGEMEESLKSLIYNYEDIGKDTDNWTIIENPSTRCTVGNIPIDGWNKIEYRYTKDWNIRFAAPQNLMETAQVGILVNTDSIHNGTTYQVIEQKKNGHVTDSLLYRQEGNRVYRYSEAGKKDILLFDFGLNEGDDFIAPDGEVWTVDEIKETAEYRDWMEKKMVLKGKEDGAVKDVWLEHVGSLYTGILTYDDLGGSSSLPQLVYCRQGDTTPWVFDVNTEHFKIVYFHPMMVGDDKEYNFIQSLSPEEVAFFESGSGRDRLYANFEENTLHVYGRIGVGCYRYPMECRIIGNEILLEVNDMHYGDWNDCGYGSYVDIRIPQIKTGDYIVKYETIDYPKEVLILTSSSSAIECAPSEEKTGNISVTGSAILCTSPDAVKLEVYTMDAVKVGETLFANGSATVKVSKAPTMYLYIVTYRDGRRKSGKVMVKNCDW